MIIEDSVLFHNGSSKGIVTKPLFPETESITLCPEMVCSGNGQLILKGFRKVLLVS